MSAVSTWVPVIGLGLLVLLYALMRRLFTQSVRIGMTKLKEQQDARRRATGRRQIDIMADDPTVAVLFSALTQFSVGFTMMGLITVTTAVISYLFSVYDQTQPWVLIGNLVLTAANLRLAYLSRRLKRDLYYLVVG